MYTIGKPNALTGRVNLRVTQSELDQLREEADMASLSLSEMVRRRYFGMPIIARSDEVTIRELRRLGGLVKHLHNQSNGAYADDVTAAIRALTLAIEQLAKSS